MSTNKNALLNHRNEDPDAVKVAAPEIVAMSAADFPDGLNSSDSEDNAQTAAVKEEVVDSSAGRPLEANTPARPSVGLTRQIICTNAVSTNNASIHWEMQVALFDMMKKKTIAEQEKARAEYHLFRLQKEQLERMEANGICSLTAEEVMAQYRAINSTMHIPSRDASNFSGLSYPRPPSILPPSAVRTSVPYVTDPPSPLPSSRRAVGRQAANAGQPSTSSRPRGNKTPFNLTPTHGVPKEKKATTKRVTRSMLKSSGPKRDECKMCK